MFIQTRSTKIYSLELYPHNLFVTVWQIGAGPSVSMMKAVRFFTNAATGESLYRVPPVIITSKMPYSPCWHEVHSF